MSWYIASIETTTSPILISSSREPAMPVLITCVTSNRSQRICTQSPAFTFPIPQRTTTASVPPILPSKKRIPAFTTSFAPVIECTSLATSTSIAPIIPIFTCYLLVEALCAKTREEKFAKAISPMRSQGLRRFGANLANEKSAHQSDFSFLSPLFVLLPRLHRTRIPRPASEIRIPAASPGTLCCIVI